MSGYTTDSNYNTLRSIGYEPGPPNLRYNPSMPGVIHSPASVYGNNLPATASILNRTQMYFPSRSRPYDEFVVNNAIDNHRRMVPPPQVENMMSRMGYQPGNGLGRRNQGITDPIEANTQYGSRIGLGYNNRQITSSLDVEEPNAGFLSDIPSPSPFVSGLSKLTGPMGAIAGTAINATAAAAQLATRPDTTSQTSSQAFATRADTQQVSNMASSALIGGDVGSLFGPVGQLAGAGIGALMGYTPTQKLATTSGDIDSQDPHNQIY